MSLIGKKKRTIELGDGLLIDVDPKLDTLDFRIGDQKRTVNKVDLWQAWFTIADEKTQDLLMPVRKTEMVAYKRQLYVRCTKDMKAGEEIVVNYEVSIPKVVDEGLIKKIEEEKK